MKNINNQKKALLLLYSYIIIFFSPKIKSNNQKKINYNDNYSNDNYIFATYDNKDIYIADELLIEQLQENNFNNIYVIDKRHEDNSNMSICDSYKILSKKDIRNIISILIEYEKKYPSNWNRTLDSLTNEWIIHNIYYYLNLEKERTEQVDLDNIDEYKYTHYLSSICKTINFNFKKTLTRSK